MADNDHSALAPKLPEQLVAEPRVRLGMNLEADWSTDYPVTIDRNQRTGNGGAATATWAPPRPDARRRC